LLFAVQVRLLDFKKSRGKSNIIGSTLLRIASSRILTWRIIPVRHSKVQEVDLGLTGLCTTCGGFVGGNSMDDTALRRGIST
jgi:hypothetical protein